MVIKFICKSFRHRSLHACICHCQYENQYCCIILWFQNKSSSQSSSSELSGQSDSPSQTPWYGIHHWPLAHWNSLDRHGPRLVGRGPSWTTIKSNEHNVKMLKCLNAKRATNQCSKAHITYYKYNVFLYCYIIAKNKYETVKRKAQDRKK